MNRYALKTKGGETIKKTNAYGIEEAITYFAHMKKLNEYAILDIYIIEKVEK